MNEEFMNWLQEKYPSPVSVLVLDRAENTLTVLVPPPGRVNPLAVDPDKLLASFEESAERNGYTVAKENYEDKEITILLK